MYGGRRVLWGKLGQTYGYQLHCNREICTVSLTATTTPITTIKTVLERKPAIVLSSLGEKLCPCIHPTYSTKTHPIAIYPCLRSVTIVLLGRFSASGWGQMHAKEEARRRVSLATIIGVIRYRVKRVQALSLQSPCPCEPSIQANVRT